jgi:anti-anti-sigma factor
MFRIELERRGKTTTLYCEGRLGFDQAGTLLRSIVFLEECKHLVLNLARVDAIDARGLGILALICQWAAAKGVKFTISDATPRVHSLIRLVNLDRFIPISEQLEPEASSEPHLLSQSRPQWSKSA